MTAVSVSGLRKSYGDYEALRGIDFTIERGEVFGLLGPNGAGKTTTIEILEGYRARDCGTVRSARRRPRAQRHAVARTRRRDAAIVFALPEPDRSREPRDVRRLLRAPARPRTT